MTIIYARLALLIVSTGTQESIQSGVIFFSVLEVRDLLFFLLRFRTIDPFVASKAERKPMLNLLVIDIEQWFSILLCIVC